MNKPVVSLIRGRSLNNWETQNFAPLQGDFDIKALSPHQTDYATNLIPFPVQKERTISDIASFIPRQLRGLPGVNRLSSERFFGMKRALAGVSVVHSVDVAHVYNEQVADLKKEMDFKFVSTMWENIPFLWDGVGMNKNKVHARKQKVMAAVDHFIAVSERAKSVLVLEGVAESKITVLPMGISLSAFKPMPKDISLLHRFYLQPENFVIVLVGKLTGYKGERELVFAAAMLKKMGLVDEHNLRFVIVGGGDRKPIQTLIDRAGVADIFRLGTVPYNEMPLVHNLADIFYLGSWPSPIWQEQFGMVLIESMACGRSIIAAESGSISEVVGDAGILVPASDFYRLSYELANLIQNSDTRLVLSERALARAHRYFNCEDVGQKIGLLYQSLLHS